MSRVNWEVDATALLVDELESAADEATRSHWEGYLKGEAEFHGVPMAGVRRAVRPVSQDYDLARRPIGEGLALAGVWFGGRFAEDQLAAVLLVAEELGDRLEDHHVDQLRRPLADGRIGDWNVCDWYATKALHAYIAGAGALDVRARAVAAFTEGDRLWERRAGLVAFVKLTPNGASLGDWFVPLVLRACEANLVSDGRFAHTGPGWVLRELSKSEPEAVAEFVNAHPALSTEARRMATARLRPGPYRRR